MPTYEYACGACGREFEVFQSIKDDPLTSCDCGKSGQVKRKIGRGAGIIFKGSGFYETDYKRSGSAKTDGTPAASTPASTSSGSSGTSASTGSSGAASTSSAS